MYIHMFWCLIENIKKNYAYSFFFQEARAKSDKEGKKSLSSSLLLTAGFSDRNSSWLKPAGKKTQEKVAKKKVGKKKQDKLVRRGGGSDGNADSSEEEGN